MKKYALLILMQMSLTALSQPFEGTVKFSIKTELTDPKMKAQMEKGMQQLNDPTTKAQIKEMQEKMNDPQMKAMMEANPQMKAQMESAMKMMQGGGANGGMSSSMPTGFIVKIKGGNSLTVMEGGMMPMEVLHLKDNSYRLDRRNKTYSQLSSGEPPSGFQQSKPQVQITKTNEKTTILNYTCIKYTASITNNGKTVNQVYWTTTEIKDFDMKGLAKQRMGRGEPMFYDGIEGVPLKIEMTMPEANMIMEAIEIQRETLSPSDFSLPADFKQTKGMF